jgi:polyribonucleotide nucleotidyltransferase
MSEKVVVERQIGREVLKIETGRLAKQAAGTVVVTYGETIVLGGVVTAQPREGIDFFPLTVDYREKTYAAGKFPGGFFKREARPSQKEILTMRMTDRPMRPLFPKGFKDEVLIQTMVLSTDQINEPDILSILAASAAVTISPIPFEGPIGACRVGYVDGNLVVNPTQEEMEYSAMDMVLAGHADALNMIEVKADELPEDVITDGLALGHKTIVELCGMISELREKAGKEKVWTPPPPQDELRSQLADEFGSRLKEAKHIVGKQDRNTAVDAIYKEAKEKYCTPGENGEPAQHDWGVVRDLVDEIEGEIVADMIVNEGKRADGRGPHDIRDIECEVQVLPRVHGSSIFQRGETQALCVITLGTTRDEQIIDGLLPEYSKKFMLHYNFPPICTGEVKRVGATSRREIGHGQLAEKSLEAVLPSPEKFPYTIRLVSEILESNGSSSMASVCGGCLALMDAGCRFASRWRASRSAASRRTASSSSSPTSSAKRITSAMMDFKVAGTQRGVTGVQLDLKARSISQDDIVETFKVAKEARLKILRKMLETLDAPRKTISPSAPRILTIKIDPEKIGRVIGPGGKGIKGIEAATGAQVEIAEDGTITVSCRDLPNAEQAVNMIEAVTAEVKVGKIYTGRVSSIKDFGAFVELSPGQDGLCHISELDDWLRQVGQRRSEASATWCR